MFGIVGTIFKFLHSVLLSIAVLVVFPSLGLFLYEQSRTFDHYMKYYHAIPYSTTYENGDVIKFYSFYQSFRDIDLTWSETVWCSTAKGGFQSIVTSSKDEIDLTEPQKYPPEIQIMLDEIHYQNSISGDAGTTTDSEISDNIDDILRTYAEESNKEGFTRGTPIPAWRLKMKRPVPGSSCHTRHRVNLETPYFKIIKTDNFFASPWTYGIDKTQ